MSGTGWYLMVRSWQMIPESGAPQRHFDVSQSWHLSVGPSTAAAMSPTSPLSLTQHLHRVVMVRMRARCPDMSGSDVKTECSFYKAGYLTDIKGRLGGDILCSEPAGDGWFYATQRFQEPSLRVSNKHRAPSYSAVRPVWTMVATLQFAAQLLNRSLN